MNKDQQFVEMFRSSNKPVIFTGAGVSAGSGIPTFRDPDGYWTKYSPHELANEKAFRENPKLVWQWYQMRRSVIREAGLNQAHTSIAEMQQRKPALKLITQNVDGLHQKSGVRDVKCLHGNIFDCLDCKKLSTDNFDTFDEPPVCSFCGGLIRPGVVWFGESLDKDIFNNSVEAALQSDLFIVIGTSAVVYPAASLVELAKQAGAKLVEINPEKSEANSMVELYFSEAAECCLPRLLKLI